MKKFVFYESYFYSLFQAPNYEELTEFVNSKDEVYVDSPWTNRCSVKTISCKWEECLQLLAPSVSKFANTLEKSFSWSMQDPWINCYQRGDYQEIHGHDGHDFSCVFFPEVKENFSQFIFSNRYSNFLSNNWIRLLGADQSLTSIDPPIKSGDIIFFPGSLLHGVTPHRSDDMRKTLSCNFDIKL